MQNLCLLQLASVIFLMYFPHNYIYIMLDLNGLRLNENKLLSDKELSI